LLKICARLADLDFDRLCGVYEYDDERLKLRNQLYDYLADDFFRVKAAFYAVWVVDGDYVSALRIEPFDDGYLVEALQTKMSERRKGYAEKLLNAVLNCERFLNSRPVYAHIYKNNRASMAVHRACGFQPYLDHAVFIDGTVSGNACTLKWIK